ncbi:MAG: DcrB-related protein [Planctomycetota bacterium]
MRNLGLCTVAVLLVLACEQEGKKDIRGRPFAGPGYALDIPAGWLVQRGLMNSDMSAAIPDSGSGDGFAENLNVVLENLPSGTTFPEYIEFTRTSLVAGLSAQVISEENVTLGGIPGRRIRYEMSMGGLRFDNDVLIVERGGGAFILTLSMLKGASRERYHAELDAVAKTFRFE